MSGRQRILTVFGTRPEGIKLFPLLHALDRDERFESRVCVSAQHREMLDQVLAIAGIEPDHDLDLMRSDQSLDALTAGLLTGVGRVMDAERPDQVVVQGDTATAMTTAIAAYYRKIPVAHVEAGLRSGDIHQPWPEEVNRKVIGTIAALHFAPTATAAEALRRENVAAGTVHVTGNTVIDALHWITGRIAGHSELACGLVEHFARLLDISTLMLTDQRRRAGRSAGARQTGPGDARDYRAAGWRRSRERCWSVTEPIALLPKPRGYAPTPRPTRRWHGRTIPLATATPRRGSSSCSQARSAETE
jgi:UDP-N-acetylglucosamine 2-epimerase (non-hydrolysing)